MWNDLYEGEKKSKYLLPVMFEGRPPHDQQPGQDVYEDSPDPGSHGVGLGGPEVDVEHHHRHTDAEGVEDHGEEDKLPEQGHHQGGGRDDLGQQEEEDSEREEDTDSQGNLLSTVRREVEHQHCQEADAHAGDDEVDGVEESLPPHGDVEGDV